MIQYFYIYTKPVNDSYYFLGKYDGFDIMPDVKIIKYCTDLNELIQLYSIYDKRTTEDPLRVKYLPKAKSTKIKKLILRPRAKFTKERKLKISQSKKGKLYTIEQKLALQELRKREFREGTRIATRYWTGRHLSKKHKAAIAKSVYNTNRPKTICQYCGAQGAINSIARYHNENCKETMWIVG